MLNLFIHKFEVVFELLKERYILVKWGVCDVIIVHLIKEKNETSWYSLSV